MGLFDTISIAKERLFALNDEKVNYYLDLITKKCSKIPNDKEEVDFQTKDLDCSMSDYIIKGDKLFIECYDGKWVEDKSSFLGGYFDKENVRLEECKHTCTITAYDFLTTDEVDIWIEFKLVFVDGYLKEINVLKYSEEDPAPRIKSHKAFEQKMIEYSRFRKTIRGKLQSCLRTVLYKIGSCISKLGSKIIALSFKL